MSDTVELSGGRRASFQVVGDGHPALVFAGGPGLPASTLRADAGLVADRLRCYLVDPPGTGSSTPLDPPARYSPWDMAHFYDEVRRSLGLDRVVAFGHSFGATVALVYAGLYPGAVAACMAGAPYSVGPDVDLPERDQLVGEFLGNLARHSGRPGFHRSCYVLDNLRELMDQADGERFRGLFGDILSLWMAEPDRPEARAVAAAMVSPRMEINLAAQHDWWNGLFQTMDIRRYAAQIRCPTLLIAGEADFLNGPAQSRVAAACIEQVQVEVIPECGHLLLLEGAGPYREAMARFLESVLGSPVPSTT